MSNNTSNGVVVQSRTVSQFGRAVVTINTNSVALPAFHGVNEPSISEIPAVFLTDAQGNPLGTQANPLYVIVVTP